jgi:hypothetical protein
VSAIFASFYHLTSPSEPIADLDNILETPEAVPEKDTTPVPEFDAIADLIPEKQRLFLKKHQKEGVAFMHKRLIAAPEGDRGCILAHSMGLGKTFQSIVFTRMFMWLGLGNTVLVIAPKRYDPCVHSTHRSSLYTLVRLVPGSASSPCGPAHCVRALAQRQTVRT